MAPDKENYVHQRSNSSICKFNFMSTDDFCVLAEHSKKIKNLLSLAFYDLISAVYMCYIYYHGLYIWKNLYTFLLLKNMLLDTTETRKSFFVLHILNLKTTIFKRLIIIHIEILYAGTTFCTRTRIDSIQIFFKIWSFLSFYFFDNTLHTNPTTNR